MVPPAFVVPATTPERPLAAVTGGPGLPYDGPLAVPPGATDPKWDLRTGTLRIPCRLSASGGSLERGGAEGMFPRSPFVVRENLWIGVDYTIAQLEVQGAQSHLTMAAGAL